MQQRTLQKHESDIQNVKLKSHAQIRWCFTHCSYILTTQLKCRSPYRKNAACLARLGPNFTHIEGILEEIFWWLSYFSRGNDLRFPRFQNNLPCKTALQKFPYSDLVSMQASPSVCVVRILPGLWQSSIVARVPVHWENVWKEPSNNDLGISNVRETFKMLRERKMSFREIFIWL